MRNVLIALVVGFVGQGVAVAIGPPGDPDPDACPLGTSVGKVINYDCGVTWTGVVINSLSPRRLGKDCIDEACTDVETSGTPLPLTVGLYKQDPGTWRATIYYYATYTGDGTLTDCDGDEDKECCKGWTNEGVATVILPIVWTQCEE